MTQPELNAVVSTAHAAGLQVMSHITQLSSYHQAISSGADDIQHICSDSPLTDAMAPTMFANGQIATPTLAISKTMIQNGLQLTWNFTFAQEGVRALQKAGVPILAGTDGSVGNPSTEVPFGSENILALNSERMQL